VLRGVFGKCVEGVLQRVGFAKGGLSSQNHGPIRHTHNPYPTTPTPTPQPHNPNPTTPNPNPTPTPELLPVLGGGESILGGRSLRYTAEVVYGVNLMGEGPRGPQKRGAALRKHIRGRWSKLRDAPVLLIGGRG